MRLIPHRTDPLYRVVRATWPNPLDASYSAAGGGRWNPPGSYPVLYACCSRDVAVAVLQDLYLDRYGVALADLQPSHRPVLAVISWAGDVVDACTAAGLAAAGLPADYPRGHEDDYGATRALGERWHEEGAEGVHCRSASLARRRGSPAWQDDEPCRTAELAIFVDRARQRPRFLERQDVESAAAEAAGEGER